MMKPISKMLLAIAVLFFTACSNNQNNDEMNEQDKEAIFKRGEQLSADLITGKAWHNKLFEEDCIYTTAVGIEGFDAGSRNVWYSHPSSQILIVLDGAGYHQIKGEAIQILQKGDPQYE